ncbi:MAG: antitoxin MazE-like protein [Sphingomonadaceae bacterium]
MNDESPRKLSKFQRYRARKKAAGLKELRMWVPDSASPQVKAQLAAFYEYERDASDERKAMEFVEAATADMLRDLPD